MNVANTFSSFVASSIVVAFIYVNGMVYFMGDFERDKCEVTYMFEYPQYVVSTIFLYCQNRIPKNSVCISADFQQSGRNVPEIRTVRVQRGPLYGAGTSDVFRRNSDPLHSRQRRLPPPR